MGMRQRKHIRSKDKECEGLKDSEGREVVIQREGEERVH
jgi:hypothetical protein